MERQRLEPGAGWRIARGLVPIVGMLAVSAFLMGLAFRSADFAWAGWISLLPLCIAIRVSTPRKVLLCGAFWGAALYISLVTCRGGVLSASVASLALLTAVPALYGFFATVVTRRVGFSPLLLALGWMGVELALRPLALHYGLLGGTQHDGLLAHSVGSLLGYVFVGFVVSYANALLLSIACEVHRRVSGLRALIKRDAPWICLVPFSFRQAEPAANLPAQPRAPPLFDRAQVASRVLVVT